LAGGAHLVLAFRVADRFGDYGITGLAIVEHAPGAQRARIDTLLMSCRVLGRNVERALFDRLVADLTARGARVLEAEYVRTTKNAQVEDLFDRFGLRVTEASDERKRYQLNLAGYAPAGIDYIEVMESDGRQG
jgi:FkbH-like protein